MKRFLCVVVLLAALCVGLSPDPRSTASGKTSKAPGVELAQALSTITGVAISPLLGVSAVGAWRYFHTPPTQRAKVSWYAQPWFWGTGFFIVLLAFIKDAFGAVLPPGWKRPFDIAELIENKLSALVAAGAFVPIFASLFEPTTTTSLADAGFAGIDPSSISSFLIMPFAIAVFVVVFLASHAINILIILSPWGAIDAVLKVARTCVLSLLTVVSLINPWVGALFSIGVIILAWFIAGWSFRLTVFGTIFSWDLLTLRRTRCSASGTEHRAFTARKIERTPVRSCGKLIKTSAGEFEFEYRPWLIFPRKVVKLPNTNLAIGNGFLYPILLRESEGKESALINFAPRYSGHEGELAQAYTLPLRDVGVYRGIKAAWRWVQEFISGKSTDTVVSHPRNTEAT
jgi:hypothetical protein